MDGRWWEVWNGYMTNSRYPKKTPKCITSLHVLFGKLGISEEQGFDGIHSTAGIRVEPFQTSQAEYY